MTHTPGPWFANRHQVETKDRIVASKLNQHDANLIAAAPDMLEALKEIANGKPWQDRFRVFVAIARYQKTARAAIAKAEGNGGDTATMNSASSVAPMTDPALPPQNVRHHARRPERSPD